MSNTEESRIIVDNYGTEAPDAARFGRGVVTLDDVKRATEARRELSDQQSTAKSGPVRRDR